MLPSERLLARLRAMGVPLPEDAVIVRTYAGYWQRREGAWTWITRPDGERHSTVGSVHRVTDLVRVPRLCAELSRHAPEWSIYPYPGDDLTASETFLVEI